MISQPAAPREPGDLEAVIRRATELHGHLCPSLVYGCRLAAILIDRLPTGLAIRGITVRHTSSCLRDGVLSLCAVRADLPCPLFVREPGRCSIEAVWDGGTLTLEVPRLVRSQVDGLRTGNDLESYRAAGVAFLLTLADEEFVIGAGA